ncbi:MAG: cation-translocating P-type ATPase [Candidatus Peribacteraceae bacterium]|nr:cation-translocating P-type ATPase [Candidatus Peribacteraceae bacterium]MDD5743016.1 cation-translocating P-type ATPase [Candidatus Peribacteraceae bacterium]
MVMHGSSLAGVPFTSLDHHPLVGLNAQDVQERIIRDGFNELPSAKEQSLFRIAFNVMREPMFLLLVACGAIYLLLGDPGEALMLLGFVFMVIGITIYQERKTERALEALRDLTSPRALVIREGQHLRIPGREVVRDDLFLIAEGDRIPADGFVLSAINLAVDESLLTGESVPVRKSEWNGTSRTEPPGGDDRPSVYSGTLVTAGKALCTVSCTGIRTEIGKIGKALRSLETEQTLLQKETATIVRSISLIGLLLCSSIVVIYGYTRGHWIEGILAGLSLAMAILPEEFPVVLTIFLALGAWRIAKRGVLTRRVPSIEMLGSASVLCVDKTGTLTLNKMTVDCIMNGNGTLLEHPLAEMELAEEFHELVEFSILASQRDPFDPMERAFKHVGEEFLRNTPHLHADWTLVREYALSSQLLAMTEVWQSPNGKDFIIAAKGAPEAMIDLCHIPPAEAQSIRNNVERMAQSGLRVLAVAKAHCTDPSLPGRQHDFDFIFLGLMGLADPVRPTVPPALQECRQAGIRVIMITGDYPTTAMSIARQIGLYEEGEMITGPELSAMDDAQLSRRIRTATVFARVIPEQKLRLVNALKELGEIVAMTGDGVNDAPALKASHIGIAMGGRGTDVAREASALVLVDEDFSSIVQAVRMGRRIFDNLKHAMSYIIAIHVPIAGLSLIPVMLGWPLILSPVLIMFLELIIDPACSIVFEMEPEEENIMQRPPRNPSIPILHKRLLAVSLLQGSAILAIVLAVFAVSYFGGASELQARTMTFTTLILANLGLILSMRSHTRSIFASLRTPNPATWWVTGSALAVLIAVLFVPFLRWMFRFAALSPFDVLACGIAGLLSIIWFECAKMLLRRHLLNF